MCLAHSEIGLLNSFPILPTGLWIIAIFFIGCTSNSIIEVEYSNILTGIATIDNFDEPTFSEVEDLENGSVILTDSEVIIITPEDTKTFQIDNIEKDFSIGGGKVVDYYLICTENGETLRITFGYNPNEPKDRYQVSIQYPTKSKTTYLIKTYYKKKEQH